MPDLLFTIPLAHLAQLVVCAVGITYVFTGSKLGYPLRFLWAVVTRPTWLAWTRSLVTCPPCNSFWSGSALALLAGFAWAEVIQIGLTTCAAVALYQTRVGGDGLAAAENWEEIFAGDGDHEEEDAHVQG